MQTALKIMPDPIAEVPRDNGRARDTSDNREQFDSVYEQQLYQERQATARRQDHDGGNDPQRQPTSKRQADERQTVAGNDAKPVGDSKVDGKVDGKVDDKVKTQSAFDQLLGLMEKSSNMLRQKNGSASDAEAAKFISPDSKTLIPHKLAIAIDNVLDLKTGEPVVDVMRTKGGNNDTLGELLKQTPDGDEKTIGPGDKVVAGDKAFGNRGKLDAIQTPGIVTKPLNDGEPLANGVTAGAAKGKSGGDQMPGILPHMDTDQVPVDGEKGGEKGTQKIFNGTQNPGIDAKERRLFTNGSLSAKDRIQTPGLVTKQRVTNDAGGKSALDPSKQFQPIDPLMPADTAAPDAGKTLPQGDIFVDMGAGKNVAQTPGIQSETGQNVAQTAGLLAGKQDKSVLNALSAPVGDDKAAPASEKGRAADSGSDNILGNKVLTGANPAKSPAASGQQQPVMTGVNPEGQLSEQQLSDRKLIESLAAESQLEQEVGLSEERPARFMAKELPGGSLNKGPGQVSTAAAQVAATTASAAVANSPLESKTTTQELTKLAETLTPAKPDFSQNMKERLTIMMNKGIQSADIRLDPGELGQMQVKMAVENDVTSVSFTVQNAQAKEVLEQAMPKLREMLAQQGLEMGEGSVQQEAKQEQELADGQHHAGQGQQGADAEVLAAEAQIDAQQLKITNGALGGIDFFA